ncbi:MAG: GTP-binding protein [Candidatus Caldarchaeum sp.]|nr:GTP-binding protein [Candidatus Caldarchaeum sp.]
MSLKRLREFHNFNVYFRDRPEYEVVAFTAAQIPGIAGRSYPTSLAGQLYPNGIPIYDESELPKIIDKHGVDLVVFSYSDVSHEEVMHKASLALARGASFMLLGPRATMLKSQRKVVAVTGVKTGVGKSTVTRLVVKTLKGLGVDVVVVRHPMPYGVLEKQVVQKFASEDDVEKHRCSVEEREEIEPHVREGTVVFTGVDYGLVLKEAEKTAEVIVWDGGNNDFPFFKPDLHLTVVDATRPGLESATYPGETNVLMADVLVIHKADKTSAEKLEKLAENLRKMNPRAEIVVTASKTVVEADVRGLRVAVVEDGPSVTHGGMSVGVAYETAVAAGAVVVDPRPYAVGSIAEAYMQYSHIGPVIPSLGYTEKQLKDLEKTLKNVPADVIVSSSPADLSKLVAVEKPFIRVWFEAVQVGGRPLSEILSGLFTKT